MATRKEYEMIFALNAQMNSSFKGTFNQAQQEFARLGNEIQGLNKVQGDISSWQKQQQAVESTSAKLENLRQQHDLLQKEIGETTGSTAGLEREKLKLEQRIDSTEGALERQKQKLAETGQRLSAAGVDTSNLAEEDRRLTDRIEDLRGEQDKAAQSAQDYGESTVSAFGAASQAIAAAGVAAAMKEIAQAFQDCVTTAADFQSTMSYVSALSGATGDELDSLTAKAKEMGAATKFTAQESGEAFSYMALAGWNTEQMLSGIEPVLNLATAAGMDLGEASDIVTDYLTAFGLTAQDAARFVDQMSYAMSHSNTDVSQLGEAYKNCAATAKSMGYSVEDTTAVLMTMANAGVKGGEAGTALNTVMTRLATNTKDCADILEDQFNVHVYDAQGNMNTLSEILNQVSQAFSTLSDEEQANLSKAIAGTNQYASFQTILAGCSEAAAAGGQSFNDYAAALEACSGSAGQMAGTMIQNLNGQLTLMDSALDALKTTIGEQFIPGLTDLAGVGTDVLTWLNEFAEEHPAVVKGVVTFTGAIGGATAALTAYAAISKVVKALDMASMFTSPVFAAVAGAAALAGLIAAVAASVDEEEKQVRRLTASSRAQYEQLQELNGEYEQAVEQYGAYSDEALALRYEVDELTDSYEANRQTMKEFTAETDGMLSALRETLGGMEDATAAIDGEEQGTLALAAKLEELSQKTSLTTGEQEQMLAVVNALNEAAPELALNYDTETGSLNKSTESIRAWIQAQAEQQRQQEKYQTWIDLVKQEKDLQEQLADAEENAALRKQELIDMGYNPDGLLFNLQTDYDDYEGEVARLEAALAECRAAQEELTGSMEEGADAAEGAAEDADALQGAIQDAAGELAKLQEAYDQAYDAALESFQGQFGLFDEAQADMDSTVESAQKALDSQLAYWKSYSEDIAVLRNLSADDLNTTQANYEALMSYVRSGTPEAAGLAASMVAAVENGNTEAIAELTQTIGEISGYQNQAAEDTALWTTGMDEEAQQMLENFRQTVADMDLSDEAKQAGMATINGFVEAAESEDARRAVQEAYGKMARYAAAAMGGITVSGHTVYSGSYFDIPGHAAGTDSAEPGAAMVGERGPELVVFRGGEQVFNAEQTRAILSRPAGGGNVTVTVSPTYQIEGGADADRLQGVFARNNGALRELVLDVVQEAQIDARRREYW